jgi:hypothetical protein
MTLEERHGWLVDLTEAQVRALASRWQIPGWKDKSADDLRKLLVRIESVEVPIEG